MLAWTRHGCLSSTPPAEITLGYSYLREPWLVTTCPYLWRSGRLFPFDGPWNFCFFQHGRLRCSLIWEFVGLFYHDVHLYLTSLFLPVFHRYSSHGPNYSQTMSHSPIILYESFSLPFSAVFAPSEQFFILPSTLIIGYVLLFRSFFRHEICFLLRDWHQLVVFLPLITSILSFPRLILPPLLGSFRLHRRNIHLILSDSQF